MKILTLNTHSLEEAQMEKKQEQFVETVLRLDPDIIALQEVNQTITKPEHPSMDGMLSPQQSVALKEDNHALALARLFEKHGADYQCAWLPIKIGYDKYDEGLAIFSKSPVLETDEILLSQKDDYQDYRTRKALVIRTKEGVFVSVHLGWWKDGFSGQWTRLKEALSKEEGPVYIAGDFNTDSASEKEGYELVLKDGWYDFYEMAQTKDDGFTVVENIDGWKEQNHAEKMRLDYIFCSQPVRVESIRTVFSGKEEEPVSDHFGLFAVFENPERQ